MPFCHASLFACSEAVDSRKREMVGNNAAIMRQPYDTDLINQKFGMYSIEV